MNIPGIFNAINHAGYQFATPNMSAADKLGNAAFDARGAVADALSKQETVLKKPIWMTGNDASALPRQGQEQADTWSNQDLTRSRPYERNTLEFRYPSDNKWTQELADAVSKQDTMIKAPTWVTGDAVTMPKLGRKW